MGIAPNVRIIREILKNSQTTIRVDNNFLLVLFHSSIPLFIGLQSWNYENDN
jgi:hypothetical protein